MSAQEARLNAATARLRLVDCSNPECEACRVENDLMRSTLESQKAAIDAQADQLERLGDGGEDLKNAEKEIRKLRRTVGRLNAELAHARKEDPKYADAADIFDYWRKELGKPRAQFTDDREKAVLKALGHYSKRQLALAILGAKYAASVGDNGVRFDDLELVCRGSKVEAFIARYQAWRVRQGLQPVLEVLDHDTDRSRDD